MREGAAQGSSLPGTCAAETGCRQGCPTCAALRAALVEALAERPFRELTPVMVAERAVTSEAALADHFGTLDRCMQATYAAASEAAYAMARDALLRGDDWQEAYAEFVEVTLGHFARTPGLARLVFIEAAQFGGPSLWSRQSESRRRFVDLLEEAHARDTTATEVTRVHLEFLSGASHQVIQQAVAAGADLMELRPRLLELASRLEPAAA